jgi:hypothetical protein
MSGKREAPAQPAKKSLADEVAEALGAERRPRPAIDELADRDSGSPGPIADNKKKP